MARERARKKSNATYEDLLALPENVVGEIVGGDLYASPRPFIAPFDDIELELAALWEPELRGEAP